jgi:hypothetical protein
MEQTALHSDRATRLLEQLDAMSDKLRTEPAID